MFQGNRKGNYVKTDDVQQSREERMARLKVELREHIRFLNDHEIMADNWLRMAESLHQIANVAFMEMHLPAAEENPLAQKGKKDTGTLWDQEKDELAIRILLEEGKLNLALRLLNKYKVAQRATAKFDELVKATCKKFNSDATAVLGRCRIFEQSVGILLKFALQHVEALQILDVPQLLTHAREVLTDALASTKTEIGADSEKLQDTLIIHYLQSLAGKMEDMDEDAIMENFEKENILPLIINHMQKHFGWYRIDTLAAFAKFVSSCMASEVYITEPDKYLPTKDLQQSLVQLKGLFIGELVSTYGLKRRDVQHLLDNLEKWEKVHGAAKVVPLKPHAKSAATTSPLATAAAAAPSKTDEKSAPTATAAAGTAAATATATAAAGAAKPAATAAPATATPAAATKK